MVYKVFVTGRKERLADKRAPSGKKGHKLQIAPKKKDIDERKTHNEADIVFLCLPDDAAKVGILVE